MNALRQRPRMAGAERQDLSACLPETINFRILIAANYLFGA